MADLVVSDLDVPPSARINLIKRSLEDRYKKGFPILKELLQNADDARSNSVLVEVCPGWPESRSPLFQGPGLLVANDGDFTDDDRRGIMSFGVSEKAADSATIGKFGLGQKAVFHLCDAFVVHVVNRRPPLTIVVNPWKDIPGNETGTWGYVDRSDTDSLVERAGRDYQHRAVILWLPFRRKNLMPAPGAGFSTTPPDAEHIILDLARTDDLRVVLTTLRHVKSIELRHVLDNKRVHSRVSIADKATRLLGPPLPGPSNPRPFTGNFTGKLLGQRGSDCFVGREATTEDPRLKDLRSNSEHWPTTDSYPPKREKGEQHGAATLLRTNSTRNELRISWAVFLPISEEVPKFRTLPVDAEVGCIHILLHGYFFLDSGRIQIRGIDEQPRQGNPNDTLGLHHAWNTQLRDTAVLPLIPSLLKDALDKDVVTADEFPHLVAALAKSTWFRDHRRAICRDYSLVRVLTGNQENRSAKWELVKTQK